MKGISTLIVLFMATHILMAQKKSVQEYISKDHAAFVANLTPYSTYNKLDQSTKDKYNISEMLAPMLIGMAGGEMDEEKIKSVQADLADAKKIGLDIESEVFVWAQKPTNLSDDIYEGEENPLFINVVLPITDGEKFRKFLDKIFGLEKTKQMLPAGGAINMVHNNMLINWNKDRFIIARSTVEQSFFEDEKEFAERSKKMLFQHANELGKVEAKNSIAQDENYQKHLHKDSDFDFWLDYDNFLPPAEMFPLQGRELYNSLMGLIGDMQIGGNGFFKNGELEFLIEAYVNEGIARVMNESYDVSPNKDFFKYIDNSNMVGMFSMAMNLKGFVHSYSEEIYKVLEGSKEGALITNMLDIVDIFIDEDEIFELLKGDMLMALTDIKVIEREETDFEYNEEEDKWDEVKTTRKDVMPLAVMMMSYGNEANIKKFIDLGANAGVLSKKADGVWAVGGAKDEIGVDVFVIMHDGILMFTNDENIPNNLQGLAKDKQMSAKDIKEISAHVQHGFMDFAKMMDMVKKASKEMGKDLPSEMDEIANTFDRIEFFSNRPSGSEMTSEFRLKLKDNKSNVIQVLVDMATKMAQEGSDSGSKATEEDSPKGTKKL